MLTATSVLKHLRLHELLRAGVASSTKGPG